MMIVCLCGSFKFYNEIQEIKATFTNLGNATLSVSNVTSAVSTVVSAANANAQYYVPFVNAQTGEKALFTDSDLQYNPSKNYHQISRKKILSYFQISQILPQLLNLL